MKFDESKIITALHPEKAEIGKKYWCSDYLLDLKDIVEKGEETPLTLTQIDYDAMIYLYKIDNDYSYDFLYPYEEPPKKRMTNQELAEWLAKGNGQWREGEYSGYHINFTYSEELDNEEVNKSIYIRPFGKTEWIEPTEIIYGRDCCGINIVDYLE